MQRRTCDRYWAWRNNVRKPSRKRGSGSVQVPSTRTSKGFSSLALICYITWAPPVLVPQSRVPVNADTVRGNKE